MRPISLRLRIGGWTVAIFTLTLAASTAAGIFIERRRLLALQAADAGSLLSHLVQMPEFREDRATAVAQLEALSGALRAAGGQVTLAPAKAPRPEGVIAAHELVLGEGAFELRYRGESPQTRDAVRQSVLLHLLHGLLALAALLAGTEWILRRGLVGPLEHIAHQVGRMQKGGGWLPRLPPSVRELDDLEIALRRLGPALESQVQQWIEAERRAAAALALNRVRLRQREPCSRALLLITDLQARDLVVPEAKPRLRALLTEIDRIPRIVAEEESERCSPGVVGVPLRQP